MKSTHKLGNSRDNKLESENTTIQSFISTLEIHSGTGVCVGVIKLT